ncbi:hypothetical protein ACJX0J_027166, partial [Zea mays]
MVKDVKVEIMSHLSHDCHVLMTQLLPVALRGILPQNYSRSCFYPGLRLLEEFAFMLQNFLVLDLFFVPLTKNNMRYANFDILIYIDIIISTCDMRINCDILLIST